MPNLISGLPLEIVELIAGHLNLSDLRSIRLSCLEICSKVTASQHFKGFCSKTQVELRISSIDDLAAVISKSKSGVERHLEHLTIVGVLCITKGLERILREQAKPADLAHPFSLRHVLPWHPNLSHRLPATEADLDDAKAQLAHFRWRVREAAEEQGARCNLLIERLASLFRVIRTHGKRKGLASLTLNVVAFREKSTPLTPGGGAGWWDMCSIAGHVFSTSLQAWKRSGIEIKRLDVFSGVEGCSIPGYDISVLEHQNGLENVHGLKELSLSISSRGRYFMGLDPDDEGVLKPGMRSPATTTEEETEMTENDPRNCTGVASWLRHIPSLEGLHLSWFFRGTSNPTFQQETIKYIEQGAPLPRLKRLKLCGSGAKTHVFVAMLRNSPELESISLHQMTLVPSNGQNWGTVFTMLTASSSKLSHIHLDNLFELNGVENYFIACFSPGTQAGDSISKGENAAERIERLGLVDWSFHRPSANGHNSFELDKREDVFERH